MNYYQIFNIPEAPVVDDVTLAKKYIELQKKYHPDYFTTHNEAEQDDALAQSAEINNGYQTLKNKDAALAYYLLHKKVIVPDEKYALPPTFLMEIMELNEAATQGNQTKAAINNYEAELYKQVSHLLQPTTLEPLLQNQLMELKEYYYKKKYLKRILERLVD